MLPNQFAPNDSVGTRVSACLAIAAAAAVFLWTYSAVAHREPVVFPGKAQSGAGEEHAPSLALAPALSTIAPVNAVELVGATRQARFETGREVTRPKQKKAVGMPKKQTHVAKAVG